MDLLTFHLLFPRNLRNTDLPWPISKAKLPDAKYSLGPEVALDDGGSHHALAFHWLADH